MASDDEIAKRIALELVLDSWRSSRANGGMMKRLEAVAGDVPTLSSVAGVLRSAVNELVRTSSPADLAIRAAEAEKAARAAEPRSAPAAVMKMVDRVNATRDIDDARKRAEALEREAVEARRAASSVPGVGPLRDRESDRLDKVARTKELEATAARREVAALEKRRG